MINNLRIIWILIISTTVLSATSCGVSKRQNFNKRKYTNLKNKQHFEDISEKADVVEVEDTEIEFGDEGLDSGQELGGPEIIEGSSSEVEATENAVMEENKMQHQWLKSIDLETDAPKPRRDFNKLSEEEQNQALIDFNWFFNFGLAMFLFAIVLLIAALILSTTSLFDDLIVLAFIGGGLIFVIWLMSLWVLNRVRKIDGAKYSRKFQIKLKLAKFIAYTGVLVSIVTVLGGVVLGLLYWTRIVSF